MNKNNPPQNKNKNKIGSNFAPYEYQIRRDITTIDNRRLYISNIAMGISNHKYARTNWTLSYYDSLAEYGNMTMDDVYAQYGTEVDDDAAVDVYYSKFAYKLKKKKKIQKANTVKTVIKEIRFGPNTEQHDFNFKLNHAIKFLKDGAKVKAYVFFKGRSIIFKDNGEKLLLKFDVVRS